MEPLLCADHITVSYNGTPVVRDVSFQVNKGEILGIVGESGSGKSTIIRAVAGLLGETGMVTRGDIWYKGENLTDMPPKKRRRYLGPEIGMVFQDSKASFCPVRTVGAQIHEALAAHERITKDETKRRAAELMEKIGLSDYERVLNSYPFELSGGMNQRVGICTAMMMKPCLLLADEPTSALDVTVQRQVAEELLMMRRDYDTAMILVTHNIGLVRRMADKILVLKDGGMRDCGHTREILENSRDPYTRELMDSVITLRDCFFCDEEQ